MKLILMTLPTYFVEEDKILSALFDEGLDILHINKPESEPIYAERLLTLLPKNYYDSIVVHQHYYLKQEYKLRGIHIDDPLASVPDGFHRHVTRSTSDIHQLKELKKECDYVLLQPLFDSLQEDVKSTLTYSQIEDARRDGIIDRHVFAFGGISLDNIQQAKDMGFGGVVVCGDLWNNFSIQHETSFHELINHFRKLRKAAG